MTSVSDQIMDHGHLTYEDAMMGWMKAQKKARELANSKSEMPVVIADLAEAIAEAKTLEKAMKLARKLEKKIRKLGTPAYKLYKKFPRSDQSEQTEIIGSVDANLGKWYKAYHLLLQIESELAAARAKYAASQQLFSIAKKLKADGL